jgi:hypothetical protein
MFIRIHQDPCYLFSLKKGESEGVMVRTER